MEKLFIKNRKGQKVAVIVEENPSPTGIVFVMHGLSGYKEAPHIEMFAEAFKENGFTVVRFDTTNTFGESDGDYGDATTTNYYEDLEDVITWAVDQAWYHETFWLAGHSLGGICIATYAIKNPNKVKAVAPISTAVSGELSKETYTEEELAEWESSGVRESESRSRPGLIRRLKWSFMVDFEKHDLLPEANKLTLPVLLIVGENDTDTKPAHQRMLLDALPGPKELHIIKGAPHTFTEEKHLKEVKEIFLTWIEKYL